MKKKLQFPDGASLGLRNKARYEVFSKLHLSPLKDTEEWKKYLEEISPQIKLEAVHQTPLQKLYMYIRLLGVFGFFVGLGLPLIFSAPLFIIDHYLGKLPPPWNKLKLNDRFQYYLIAGTSYLCGAEVEVRGEERRIPGVLLQMYNHASYIDPPSVGIASRIDKTGPLLWIGKKSLLYLPVFGQCIYMFGHLLVDRSKREVAVAAMQSIVPKALQRGQPISIAPEGTRSRTGYLQEFKKGAFHLRKDLKNCPIVPAFIAGGFECFPRGQAFVSMARVSVTFGDPVNPPDEETTDETRIRMYKMYLEMVPHAYTSTTATPVSNRFLILHFLWWIMVFLHWKMQMLCAQLLLRLFWN